MNVPIKSESITAARSFAGCVSLVTGSTSGIGLGIARALAAAGSEIILNGFGTPESIAEAQAQIAIEFNVRVLHSPADMSNPASIREMVEKALASFGRRIKNTLGYTENRSRAANIGDGHGRCIGQRRGG